MVMSIRKLLFLTYFLDKFFFPFFFSFFFFLCLFKSKEKTLSSAEIEKHAKNISLFVWLGPLIENVQFLLNGDGE